MFLSLFCFFVQEEKEETWLTQRKIQKATWQHKHATKHFDYTNFNVIKKAHIKKKNIILLTKTEVQQQTKAERP